MSKTTTTEAARSDDLKEPDRAEESDEVFDKTFKGMVTLPGLIDQERNDPGNYVLVHHELLDEMFEVWGETPGLKKGLRTLQRKLNRERREGKLLLTRTARKLRKARAGRDRRDRQLQQAMNHIKILQANNQALASVLDVMSGYNKEQ